MNLWNKFSSKKGEKDLGFASKVRKDYLQPLSLHQALEAPDSPAGRIKDDLSQRGHLQGGVCPLRAMNEH